MKGKLDDSIQIEVNNGIPRTARRARTQFTRRKKGRSQRREKNSKPNSKQIPRKFRLILRRRTFGKGDRDSMTYGLPCRFRVNVTHT